MSTKFQAEGLSTLSDDIFDELMGDAVPDSSVTEESILGSQNTSEEVVEEKTTKVSKKSKSAPVEEITEEVEQPQTTDVDKDLEDIFDEVSDKTSDPKEIQVSDGEFNESEFFKAKYEGLVKRGTWQEIDEESLAEFEWNEESYGELAVQQAKWAAEEEYNKEVESTGFYGKTIIDFIKKGGNPEDIISIFQEAEELNKIDTSTESGKVQFLKEYYVKELGWSETKFKRESDSWIDREVIDEEIAFVESKFQEKIQSSIEQKKIEADQYREQQRQLQEKFATNMSQTVSERSDLSTKEKQDILDSLLRYDKRLPDGRVVNQFTLDFMKLQANPKDYIDFVIYVRNPEKYKERFSTKVESENNKKNWNLIKGGGSLSRKTSAQAAQKRNTVEQKGTDFNYISLLNRK